MLSFNMNKISVDKNYSHCYGCGMCTLVCPVWHQSRDVVCTPHGHAKALQSGGEINIAGLFDCILCGACTPVCPENIDLMQMLLELRCSANNAQPLNKTARTKILINKHRVLFLADDILLQDKNKTLLEQTLILLKTTHSDISLAIDSGKDITLALQSGNEISPDRLEEFLTSIKSAKKLIVSDGLLKSTLQQWLPRMKIESLGYILSKLPSAEKKLTTSDLYIIESLAYNTDFKNMVTHYNQLKRRSGCRLNLDLQRLAMPTGGIDLQRDKAKSTSSITSFDAKKQSQWILQGQNFDRIVCEHVADTMIMAQVSNKPVIHLAELLSN